MKHVIELSVSQITIICDEPFLILQQEACRAFLQLPSFLYLLYVENTINLCAGWTLITTNAENMNVLNVFTVCLTGTLSKLNTKFNIVTPLRCDVTCLSALTTYVVAWNEEIWLNLLVRVWKRKNRRLICAYARIFCILLSVPKIAWLLFRRLTSGKMCIMSDIFLYFPLTTCFEKTLQCKGEGGEMR